MTKKTGLKLPNQSGFTIVEVLIASTVFVIAFTVMVTLLDRTINRFSTKDLTIGTNLAQDFMLTSLTTKDTTSFDSLVTRVNVSYRAIKKITVNDRIAQITIEVKREKTNRKIISLYNEILIPQKQ